MVVRKHKSNENYLIDFLSSAPVSWKPASEEVLMNRLVSSVDSLDKNENLT